MRRKTQVAKYFKDYEELQYYINSSYVIKHIEDNHLNAEITISFTGFMWLLTILW